MNTDINDVNKILGSIKSDQPLAKMETCEVTFRQWLRRLYYRICKRYRRLEYKFVSYDEGNKLIRQNAGKPDHEQWVLALPEEDNNHLLGWVCLERKQRITE
jgi:hypothetical protein